jgi:ribosomal protein S18 acetylase RimI-like enzyme
MTSSAPIVKLRPAAQTDLPFLDNLRHTVLYSVVTNHHEWDDAKQMARVRAHFDSAQIIMIDDNPIGLWKTYRDDDHLHLSQIQILPEYQGRGIGTQLISGLQEDSKRIGLPITLHVYRSNPAVRLYLRRGFHISTENREMLTMIWIVETE